MKQETFIDLQLGLSQNLESALDDYVYSKESLKHFSWYHAKEFDFRRTNVITNVSYDAYVLNMTSGKWLNGELFYFSPHLHIKSDRFN